MKRSRWYKIFYLGLIFLMLYVPFVRFMGLTIHLPYIFLAICSIFFFYVVSKRRSISKIYLNFILLYWIGGIWVYLVGVFFGNLDNVVLFSYFTGTLSVFAAYPIVKILSKYAIDNDVFIIRGVYLAGLAHAFIMVLAFFWAPFRNVLYTVIPLGESGEDFVEYMIRSPGLTTGGGDALSVIQCLALIFGIYYLTEVKKKVGLLYLLKHLLCFMLLFLSILLSARTGLVIIFAYLAWLILFRIWRFFLAQRISRSFVSKILIILLVSSICISAGFNFLMNSEYSRFANRAFELFINYVETGSISSSSSEALQDMYILPQNNTQLLFGDGNFGRNEKLPYVSSDIGYVRIIYGVGLVGCLVLFLPLFYSCYIAIRYLPLRYHLSTLIIITSIIILIVNSKTFYYFEFRESFRVLFLLLVSLTLTKVKKEQYIKVKGTSDKCNSAKA